MRILVNKNAPVIILEVELLGKIARCKIDMALDTGATFTMIPWDIAERLGYDPAISTERIIIATTSTIERVPVITLERMKVLGAEMKKVKVIVHDLPPKSNIDGFLGLSFLKHFDIDLYLKAGYLEFVNV